MVPTKLNKVAKLSAEWIGTRDQCRRRLDDGGNDRGIEQPATSRRASIRQISEDQTKLLFECEEDSTLDVTTVDPGNSVIVRDKNGQVEYLG